MRRYSVGLALLLVLLAPGSIPEATPQTAAITPRRQIPQAKSVTELKDRLLAEGRNLAQHGLYAEMLEDSQPIAAHNEDLVFNPASVIKLATSLAALDQLGPDHRFRTEFRAAGDFDRRSGVLDGDLILWSGGDPSFSIPDAREAGEALRRLGLRRVRGNLVVAGAFNCNYNTQTDVSAGVFRRQSRLLIEGATRFTGRDESERRGEVLLTVESSPLIRIIHHLNAHSVNSMAELLATHIGGVEGIERFLLDRLRLEREKVLISRASGLDINRLSARGTVEILRSLLNWIKVHDVAPEDVLPVAAIDSSTLSDRFTEERFAGSVLAKTGTLYDTDGGVAALAGIAFTARGTLLFAIYNMAEGRRVEPLRHVQDTFLKNLIDEIGGPAPRVTDLARREIGAPTGQILLPSIAPRAAD